MHGYRDRPHGYGYFSYGSGREGHHGDHDRAVGGADLDGSDLAAAAAVGSDVDGSQKAPPDRIVTEEMLR